MRIESILVSPELALVDPELRKEAVAVLEQQQPAMIVSVAARPAERHVQAQPSATWLKMPFRRRLVAVFAYILLAVARVLVADALCVLVVVLLALALSKLPRGAFH